MHSFLFIQSILILAQATHFCAFFWIQIIFHNFFPADSSIYRSNLHLFQNIEKVDRFEEPALKSKSYAVKIDLGLNEPDKVERLKDQNI